MSRNDWEIRQPLLFLFVFILLTALFWIKSVVFLDPDFGWELITGEYILKHGVPKTDPFSYTMPTFPLVAHSWLSDVGFAILFPHIGYSGLAMICSFLAVSSLFIMLPSLKRKMIIPLLFCMSALLPYANVRPQVFTWFFAAVVIRLLTSRNLWQRFGWTTPLIMTIWVNMHGGFAVGLAIVIIAVLTRALVEKKIETSSLIIMLATAVATLINPYGLSIWREVTFTFFSGSLRASVSEWLPTTTYLHILSTPPIAFGVVFYSWFHHRLIMEKKVLFPLLLLIGLSATKLYPLFILISLFVSASGLLSLHEAIKKMKDAATREWKLLWILLAGSIVVSILHIPVIFKAYLPLSENRFYPQEAIAYMREHPRDGQLFSVFYWGGYLLQHYPEKKVFVDGRMSYWSDPSLPFEHGSPLQEQLAILSLKKPVHKSAVKYGITRLLLPRDAFGKESEFAKNVSLQKWFIEYEDSVATIYRQTIDLSL